MRATTKSDLLTLIAADVTLKKVANTHGGEYAGPCPFCGGTDRFRVWPNAGESGRYKCLGYAEGRAGCGRGGDAIQYLRERDGLSYREACAQLGIGCQRAYGPRLNAANHGRLAPCLQPTPSLPERLEPPGSEWQAAAWQFVRESMAHLQAVEGAKALAWLQRRGLDLATIRHATLGYNPADRCQARAVWGLPPAQRQDGDPKRVWLPRGIVIPWSFQHDLWRVNIRRPVGDPKYVGPAGWKNALYVVDEFDAGAQERNMHQRPVVLVEGELDALSVYQAAGDLAVAVATGSTAGARHLKWIAWLAAAPLVLVAYDADAPGEQAAAYWLEVLPNAKRWRPFWQDANAMAQDGADLRAWIEVGLTSAESSHAHNKGSAAEGENNDSRAD